MKRRNFLAGMTVLPPALWLAGCTRGEADASDSVQAALAALISDERFGAPGAMGVIIRAGAVSEIAAAGTARFDTDGITALRPLAADQLVRAASISKLATALVAGSLADEGVLDLDADITESAGMRLDGPGLAGKPVSLRQLLAHTSGLQDPDTYWLDAPGRIEALLTEDAYSGAAPGERFIYCNLGYGVAATVMERITAERFDRLVDRRVTAPLGLSPSAFNWSGTSEEVRREAVSLYVREAGRWQAAFDTPEFLDSGKPGVLLDEGFLLENYEIGSNGTIFGPQGGYRTGIEGMARLALAFAGNGPGARLAEPIMANAEPGEIWGTGPQILPAGLLGDHPELVGHPGEAYGFYGGAWAVRDGSLGLAYCVTGADRAGGVGRDPVSGFTRWEQTCFALLAAHAGLV